MLRLMFICCHPSLIAGRADDPHAQAGRRADHTRDRPVVPHLRGHGRPAGRRAPSARSPTPARRWRSPTGAERAGRLTTVLGVVYLLFNEGYSATAGDDWMRPALCDEAIRLGRILTALGPTTAEVHGLSALMELQSSRLGARTGPDGEPVLLLDQDRSRWDPHPPAARPCRPGRGRGADGGRRPGPTCCRPRSPPATHGPAPPRTTDWARIADAVRAAGPDQRIAGGRAEPGGRAGHGLRPGGRPDPGRPTGRAARAARLPPVAERPRRPAGQARAARGGAGGVRTRSGA